MNGATKFCLQCGGATASCIPPGDNRQRDVCDACGHIQYQNPKIVTGCIPIWGERVLLCKRAIEPRFGYWTLPAGFLENGETLLEGALRETDEEVRAKVMHPALFGVYNVPHIHQVHVIYHAQLTRADGFGVGDECSDAGLFTADEIPWEKIAFRVVDRVLQRYWRERAAGQLTFQVEDIR